MRSSMSACSLAVTAFRTPKAVRPVVFPETFTAPRIVVLPGLSISRAPAGSPKRDGCLPMRREWNNRVGPSMPAMFGPGVWKIEIPSRKKGRRS